MRIFHSSLWRINCMLQCTTVCQCYCCTWHTSFVSLQQSFNYCRKCFLSSSSSSSSPIQCSSDRGKKGRRRRRWSPKCWSYYRNPWNWTSILLVRRATKKLYFYLFDLYKISVEYIVLLCSPYSFSLLVFTLVNNFKPRPNSLLTGPAFTLLQSSAKMKSLAAVILFFLLLFFTHCLSTANGINCTGKTWSQHLRACFCHVVYMYILYILNWVCAIK